MVENISPRQTWDALRTDPQARLVDVRTQPEWDNIGIPELADAGQPPVLISWQVAPSMQVNAGFVDDLRSAGLTGDHKLYFLCRSGARSMAAAQAAQAAGFAHVYNIADGFEGPPDASGQRGHVAGWQADGLPTRRG
jgi:rhodanese-related sulfurtransferase